MSVAVYRWLLLSALATLALSLPLPEDGEDVDYVKYEDMLVSVAPKSVSTRGMLLEWRWPNAVVPYVISSTYSATHRAAITDAMGDIVRNTCVRFVPRTSEKTYIDIKHTGQGCFATLGYGPSDARLVSLDAPGCLSRRGIIHELMHVLGFIHEQDREDRDYNVIILLDNINQGSTGQMKWYDTVSLGVPYNQHSAMHYSSMDFSINGKPSIISTRVHHPVDNTVVAYSDYRRIARLYSCPQSYEDALDKLEY